MSDAVVEVRRGAVVESRHRVHVAVVDAGGRVRAYAGDPELIAFARSSVKALQALPLAADGVVERFGLNTAELALCCGSHSGEEVHVRAARSILRKAGVPESALACGPQPPLYEPAHRALLQSGDRPGRIHNNCSGKHAGLLALARHHGWPLEGYERAAHPVQQRMLKEIAEWTSVPAEDIGTAVDGCGILTFALPLSALALSFARLANAARSPVREENGSAAGRVVAAMLRHPDMVGGTGRLDTELMRLMDGRVFAKVGAEGVYCAGSPGAELGVALKVEDGARRAAEPALLAVLRRLGLMSDDEFAELGHFGEPGVLNTRGQRVGEVRALVELTASNG